MLRRSAVSAHLRAYLYHGVFRGARPPSFRERRTAAPNRRGTHRDRRAPRRVAAAPRRSPRDGCSPAEGCQSPFCLEADGDGGRASSRQVGCDGSSCAQGRPGTAQGISHHHSEQLGVADVKVFVAARGNRFMHDIAGWIAEAAASTGRHAELIDDRLPNLDGSINLVVAPHEFFELYPAPAKELQRAAAASICINTEQPGTKWFRLAVDACRRGLFTLDINELGVDALHDLGVAVERLRLGGVPSMRAQPSTTDREIDVLFLGGLDDRRGGALAELAVHLWDIRADMRLMSLDHPIDASTPDAVFGSDKYRLLANSKVLLNIHRDRPDDIDHPPYFEWARAVEVMANGCVIVSEPSVGYEPLEPGSHFVETPLDDMGAAVRKLLADDSRRADVAERAHEAVFGELALATSLAPLLERIEADVLFDIPAHAKSSASR